MLFRELRTNIFMTEIMEFGEQILIVSYIEMYKMQSILISNSFLRSSYAEILVYLKFQDNK